MTSEVRKRQETAQVAALILSNALLFHEELARVRKNLRSLRRLAKEGSLRDQLEHEWEEILKDDYVPIFRIALDILIALPELNDTDRALRMLTEAVLEVSRNRAALRHDLMGRIYHTLLQHKKYLGTYYTSVSSATLLLKLTLDINRWDRNWADLEALKEFRIADIACGTGTLLMAAQQAVTDNYVRHVVDGGARVTTQGLQDLHRVMMEQTLHGYDVLTSAVHLTASTLAILSPEVTFNRMNLFCLRLEARPNGKVFLGSVDYATEANLGVQMDLMQDAPTASKVTGEGETPTGAPLPKLDLCVMNPPFTRSVGDNLLFGSRPLEERRVMQKSLSALLRRGAGRRFPLKASSTAGLGSVFVAVADRYIKEGGRLALVLPQAIASGVAWKPTRELLAEKYVLEVMVVSHDPARWNFSDSTDLSEILLVARRKRDGEFTEDAKTLCINLWKNPDTVFDAVTFFHDLQRTVPADLEGGHGVAPILVSGETHAELVQFPWTVIKDDQWYPCMFAQTELVRTAHYLRQGSLYIAPQRERPEVPLTHLSSLGELGPDVRDIHDGFTVTKSRTAYSAFWSHDADRVLTLAMETNAHLQPLAEAKDDRPLRDVGLLWPRAGRIMIAERMRFNTQRAIAVRLPRESLSNVWWPFRCAAENKWFEKALVLWLNSTLGLINVMSHRVSTQGAWVKFKKPHLASLPVLDLWRLDVQQLKQLAEGYDEVCGQTLLPLPQMADDPVRETIDDCIRQTLNLPPLTRLREVLAREPVICLQPLYR